MNKAEEAEYRRPLLVAAWHLGKTVTRDGGIGGRT
jgi:hypothetical protein